jgi:hypothetical protein
VAAALADDAKQVPAHAMLIPRNMQYAALMGFISIIAQAMQSSDVRVSACSSLRV